MCVRRFTGFGNCGPLFACHCGVVEVVHVGHARRVKLYCPVMQCIVDMRWDEMEALLATRDQSLLLGSRWKEWSTVSRNSLHSFVWTFSLGLHPPWRALRFAQSHDNKNIGVTMFMT